MINSVENTKMEITMNSIHQGRWGYHSCSYTDFKKIKLLHKHYWLAKYAQAANNRYYRKLPKNRVIRRRKDGNKPIPMPAPFYPDIYRKILREGIIPLYQQARHPNPDPKSVSPLAISMSYVENWLTEIEKACNTK